MSSASRLHRRGWYHVFLQASEGAGGFGGAPRAVQLTLQDPFQLRAEGMAPENLANPLLSLQHAKVSLEGIGPLLFERQHPWLL